MHCTTKLRKMANLWASIQGIDTANVRLYQSEDCLDLDGNFISEGIVDACRLWVVAQYYGTTSILFLCTGYYNSIMYRLL